ncbi:hypothetical protein MNBD_ALPHA04-1421 [hydrothermal vent metagenome]|uniref:Uncharacterized protein n=1 Tax=hydrothermal vent metagenome TaxID=652676 RepID=A0A3B0SY54_9ZZZZ
MKRIATDKTELAITHVIDGMPSWLRHDLASERLELRQRAQDALAAQIVDRLTVIYPIVDKSQLALPIR